MANNRPVKYLQTDSKWKNIKYATKYENATIGGSGCGPTAMAMVIATWKDPTVTPVTTCKWSVNHGYKATGNGTYHSYFVPQAKAYGLECYRLNTTSFQYCSTSQAEPYHQKAWEAVEDGNLVICLMGKGNWTTGGHYILWYDNSGSNVLINDPASTKSTREKNTFALLKSQVRFYWVVKVPEEVVSMTNTDVKNLINAEATRIANEKINAYFANLINSNEPSNYKEAQDAWKIAKDQKLFDGTMPKMYMTREQFAIIANRIGLVDKPE